MPAIWLFTCSEGAAQRAGIQQEAGLLPYAAGAAGRAEGKNEKRGFQIWDIQPMRF